jgi:ribosomal protein S6
MEDSRMYEFGYHITTKLDEARVPQIHAEVEGLITKAGGTIMESHIPERRRLSYPINHQSEVFFGWVTFGLENGEFLAELDEWARLNAELVRHVTLRLEPESDKRATKQAAHLERKAAKTAKEGAAVKKTTVEKKSDDTGKLETQLEDVLGNL